MDQYIGLIKLFPYNFVPNEWLQCNGATLSIQNYSTLYALIGTTYGGNGTTTFNLPNLANTAPTGASKMAYYIAYTGIFPTRP